MRTLALLVFLAPLALSAQPALTVWPAPEVGEDSITLCTTKGTDRVCRRPSDDGDLVFTAEYDGQPRSQWSTSGGMAYDFVVLDADLDGDGHPERVVANNDGVSNGMGVAYWTLYVLDESAPLPASVIPVEEFGPGGESFAADDGLVLWATEWLGGPDPSGRRGEGLYFVGRPFRFERGRLVPAADLPIRARRFLGSFAEARGSGPPNPAGWLSDRRAETRTTDPFLRGGELIDFQGRVTSVEAAPAEYGRTNWVVTLTTSDGGTAVLTYADGWGGESEPPFTHFGEAASGRLYPPGYRPFALADWISGRTVTAVTYADDHAARRVLWLE